MKEVLCTSAIKERDYNGLISYCTVLENNYTRLSNLNCGFEMGNKITMSSIVLKFPNVVKEKWAEFISQQDDLSLNFFLCSSLG